jgi:hypothetical protein
MMNRQTCNFPELETHSRPRSQLARGSSRLGAACVHCVGDRAVVCKHCICTCTIDCMVVISSPRCVCVSIHRTLAHTTLSTGHEAAHKKVHVKARRAHAHTPCRSTSAVPTCAVVPQLSRFPGRGVCMWGRGISPSPRIASCVHMYVCMCSHARRSTMHCCRCQPVTATSCHNPQRLARAHACTRQAPSTTCTCSCFIASKQTREAVHSRCVDVHSSRIQPHMHHLLSVT